jgi:hypothetical protein
MSVPPPLYVSPHEMVQGEDGQFYMPYYTYPPIPMSYYPPPPPPPGFSPSSSVRGPGEIPSSSSPSQSSPSNTSHTLASFFVPPYPTAGPYPPPLYFHEDPFGSPGPVPPPMAPFYGGQFPWVPYPPVPGHLPGTGPSDDRPAASSSQGQPSIAKAASQPPASASSVTAQNHPKSRDPVRPALP